MFFRPGFGRWKLDTEVGLLLVDDETAVALQGRVTDANDSKKQPTGTLEEQIAADLGLAEVTLVTIDDPMIR